MSSPKDHVIDLCDINASLLPRPGIEPGPAVRQARTLALHHMSDLPFNFMSDPSNDVSFISKFHLKQGTIK